jgi:hypothetical protein
MKDLETIPVLDRRSGLRVDGLCQQGFRSDFNNDCHDDCKTVHAELHRKNFVAINQQRSTLTPEGSASSNGLK